MDPSRLYDADTAHAVEIAERVWWVGHLLDDETFQCHVYLLEQGDQSVLFDPGSVLTFAQTKRKIEEVVPFDAIRYFVCQHQDPDIAAAMPQIDALVTRDDAALITHSRTQVLLKHYGLRLPFWLVDEHHWRIALEDRSLSFVFTPYAHFPGAICSYDEKTGVLFSSDLYGGFTETPALVARDESHFEALRPFHEHYMPSRDVLNFALNRIARHDIEMIAPQHGSIIPRHLVAPITEQLRRLECGIYLFAEEHTDIDRLSRLNATLHEITETMLHIRDFADIAARLLEVVQHNLPAERMDYYALVEGDRLLTLSHEHHDTCPAAEAPADIAAILGKTQAEWEQMHRECGCMREHTLHPGPFCSRPDGHGGLILTLPLFSSARMDAAATIRLNATTHLPHDLALVIRRLAMPLQVALQREVFYRGIEQQRQDAYQRSIRDPLTGLFSRLYMDDVVGRYCAGDSSRERTRVGAVMVDLDRFKRINDRFGHTAGDLVLRQFAERLQCVVGKHDIAVRFGGEEFIVFSIGACKDETARLAEHLRDSIAARPFDIGAERRLQVTASIGIACRLSGESLDGLIQRADAALYLAKRGGRNQVRVAADTPVSQVDPREHPPCA
ncbi:MAG: diguanylate cyclase [Thiohalocapsa sp.]|nr:diguanylate cyclase [Thiohalocapsa sp.]